MAYIGPLPAETFTSFATQEFSTSATTSYTLDHAVTNENEIALFINNVRQQPGSGKAYTATGTALTLSAATASTDTMYAVFLGRALQTVNPADASVGTSQLAATSVTAAKLNNDIISGQTALAETPADTDELLVSDAGTLKRVDFSHLKGGGQKTLLHTITASNSSSVEFDNTYITSTYRDYHITWSNVHSASDARLDFKVSDDNGSSYKTDSDHQRASFGLASDSSTISSNSNDSGTQFEVTPLNLGSDTGESTSGHLTLFNFLATDNFKQSQGHVTFTLGNQTFAHFLLSFTYKKTNALNAVKFVMSSGNISSGVFKIYGIT